MIRPISGYNYAFPMTSVATDVAVFHATVEGGLYIALVRRNEDADAFPSCWGLPGGFFRPDEDRDIESCALRELSEEAGASLLHSVARAPHFELIGVYSARDRDPRPERVISIAYLAVVTGESIALAPVPNTDVNAAQWFRFEELSGIDLAFDHGQVIRDARKKLADSISFARKEDDDPDLLFASLPDEFTLRQAQVVLETLKGKPLEPSSSRKYIEKFVVPTGEIKRCTTRPAALYRRRRTDPTNDGKGFSPGLVNLRMQAVDYQIPKFDHFLEALTSAPDFALSLLTGIVYAYGRHRDYRLNATAVPDLRFVDDQTERVLMTMKWQSSKKVFCCTALALPSDLAVLGLSDLRAHKGTHRAAFTIGSPTQSLDQDLVKLDRVLGLSRPKRS